MNSMWSDRKYVNTFINILLFLTGINFLHYGQLMLPIICLILFIDQGFKLSIKNYKTFIILCVFGVAFFCFSFKEGLYSVMGLFLPMAYYIGSNLRTENKENIRKLIYIIAYGMACHMILNFILEIMFWHDNLSYLFNKPSHYDVWLFRIIWPGTPEWRPDPGIFTNLWFSKIRVTATSINYIMIASCIYYLLFKEDNKKYKYTGIILFIISSVYCLALGRRTTVFILAIALLLSIVYDFSLNKTNDSYRLIVKKVLIFIGIVLAVFVVLYLFNVFNLREIINNLSIVKRFLLRGLKTERLEIFIKSIQLAPKYPFGGRKISDLIGYSIHDLWGDIYDFAGIVPYLLMLYYSIGVLLCMIKVFRNNRYDKNMILFIVWFAVCSIMMFIEPVMTGASIYLICFVIIVSAITTAYN